MERDLEAAQEFDIVELQPQLYLPIYYEDPTRASALGGS
jgi:hypothetical protein